MQNSDSNQPAGFQPGHLLLVGLALLGAIFYFGSKRKPIFVSFAVEDRWARDLLLGQAKNRRIPFTFSDMSLQEPFDDKWKSRCRERMRRSSGVIALLSKHTRNAEGARWEMHCAVEEKIPIVGIHIHKGDKGAVPPELKGQRVIEWNWDDIDRFIKTLR